MASLFQKLVKEAVVQHVDPWADKCIHKIPAEKVTRYTYIPAKGDWQTDVSLIKMEAKPFDHGAQRQCYRMKKISQAPTSHWKKDPLDWRKAPNYVVKCYLTPDGAIGVNNNRDQCFEDVKIQYEASYWAAQFNKAGPPKHIQVIQCHVLELGDREGKPVVGCERFVDGHDKSGAGFVKHNSNSGFVDDNQSRSTPQAFSAHSFYESQGRLMVVDIQGVGDLYTDPQIHSQETKFGNSDLGVRGMALFFVSFRRNPVCDALQLPRFPLSSRERKRIQSSFTASVSCMTGMRENASGTVYANIENTSTKGDMLLLEKELADNPTFSSLSLEEQRHHLASSMTDVDRQEVEAALLAAYRGAQRVHTAVQVGAYPPAAASSVEKTKPFIFPQFVKFKNDATPGWTARLQKSAAEVHLEVAVLEAAGRFSKYDANLSSTLEDVADVASCLFHLCEASLLGSCAAALALARLRAGLGTALLEVLGDYVATDRAAALCFYQLAAVRGSVAGAWQAGQISTADGDAEGAVFMYELVLVLMGVTEAAAGLGDESNTEQETFSAGDPVEGNHYGCGSWHEAMVVEVIRKADAEAAYFVKYTADGEEETLSRDLIRRCHTSSLETNSVDGISSPSDGALSATASSLKGEADKTCCDALGEISVEDCSPPAYEPKLSIGDDGVIVPELFEVYAALGQLQASLGQETVAWQLLSDAAEAAMEAGKPRLANKYMEQAAEFE